MKNPKKSVLTSLEQRFQKAFFLIFPEGYLCKVHPGRGMIETHKDKHTYRHTHRRTDMPLFLVSIFSPSVTDYKQENQGVNNIFSHFLRLNFFRIIRIIKKHNNKNQVAKILSPPGFEPGTSDTGLKTKNAGGANLTTTFYLVTEQQDRSRRYQNIQSF